MHKQLFKLIFVFQLAVSFSLIGQFGAFHKNLEKNCRYCHINEVENSESQVSQWQESNNNSSYIPYSSSTLDAEVSIPMGSSKLCLSCHDGTISMEHINLPNLSSAHILNNNLSASHPVSFKYDSYLAYKDGELHDPNSSSSGLGGTISSDLLIDGKLECISCHDIHGIRKQNKLLVMSNYRSKLCLTCHNK